MGGANSGRKPTPTYLKVVRGNPGKRPLNKNEPKPEFSKEVLKPPKGVGLKVVGRKEWKRVAPILYRMRVLTEIDKTNLICYCLAFQTYVKANRAIETEGIVVQSARGFLVESPYIKIIDKKQKEMRSFMIELGMTPSSRSKLSIEPPANNENSSDNLDDFIGK